MFMTISLSESFFVGVANLNRGMHFASCSPFIGGEAAQD